MDPAIIARATALVTRFQEATRVTRGLQELAEKPPFLSLQKKILESLDSQPGVFLAQKQRLSKMPEPVLKKINRECTEWCHFPLVNLLVSSYTRDLYLDLSKTWTSENMCLVFTNIAQQCETSLRTLEIRDFSTSHHLHVAHLGSRLLSQLRGLTELHVLSTGYQWYETDQLISILAETNPNIESLAVRTMTKKSLDTIADHWPNLRGLEYRCTHSSNRFESVELDTYLPRLRNLQDLDCGAQDYSRALLQMARNHNPTSPPYKLKAEFNCDKIHQPLGSSDWVQLFSTFPALCSLTIAVSDIPGVCAGLEGRDHIHITTLEVKPNLDPHALEPLLALTGKHLLTYVSDTYTGQQSSNRVDLNMIGHYCPNLLKLDVHTDELISGDEYEITDSHFSQLESCEVKLDSSAHVPDALVRCLLASPHLTFLYIDGVRISQAVADSLVSQGGEQRPLSSLTYFLVRHPEASCEVLAQLMSYMPSLHSLTLLDREYPPSPEPAQEIRDVLGTFVQLSGLKANVSVD